VRNDAQNQRAIERNRRPNRAEARAKDVEVVAERQGDTDGRTDQSPVRPERDERNSDDHLTTASIDDDAAKAPKRCAPCKIPRWTTTTA